MSLLPPNATEFERALETGIDLRFAPLVPQSREIWNPATCPPAFLPFLAWALSVDSWDPAWSIATQRAVIAASPAVHRAKGTRKAVEDALAALMVAAVITEWWQVEPNLTPASFVVRVYAHSQIGATAPALTADLIAAIKAFVAASAPVSRRWHLEIGILTLTAWSLAAAASPALKILDIGLGVTANPTPRMTLTPFAALARPLRIINLDLAIPA